ncbi:extracellular solute-binding protein [Modestobacter muralis]|uniref:Extracellular solute-binding protein n=1 Tax=Modestobacter muralis TaxID=1608614 RepID=A0A6P0HAC7_9ACTN|nr:extracellular solute-binding protein [Modestobacter muralis]NEN51989.1 extracellular solute-binding protein [Modestobacter muralis]
MAVSATTLALLGSMAACGSDNTAGGSGGGEGGGTADVWALQDTSLNPIEEASIQRYNDGEGPGSVKLSTFGNDPYKQRLRTAINSPQAPDVFFNWGGGSLKEYVDAGKIEDLTPMLDENPELKEAFLPSVLAGAEIDGKQYGLPMRGVQPVLMFGNLEVLKANGINEMPATWEDLLADVATLKGAGLKTPIALAGSQPWTELMWAEYLLDRVAGPEVFQAIRDGEGQGWNDPKVLEAMTMLKQLIDAGAFGAAEDFSSTGYDAGGTTQLLANGDAGFHLMGSWEFTNQLGTNPDFVEAGNLGYAPFPSVQGGAGDPSNLVGNVSNFYSVTSASPNKEAALEYVKTALTDETYVSDLIKAGDVMPIAGAREQLAAADNGEYLTEIYDLTSDAKNFQLSWDQDLAADEASKMLTELSNLFLGQQTPEGFVAAMAG